MKRFSYPLVAFVIMLASAFTLAQSANWKIADNYSVKFTGENGEKQKDDPSGEFKGLKGAISFDPANLAASKFNVSIDVASINTGNGMKNTHAKSDKWFDAEKYPTITFVSSSITKASTGFEAKGTLSIHGVDKQITLPFNFANNTFTASFEIDRLDYKINVEEPAHGASKFKVDLTVPVTKE